jgi:hypothetical protein
MGITATKGVQANKSLSGRGDIGDYGNSERENG